MLTFLRAWEGLVRIKVSNALGEHTVNVLNRSCRASSVRGRRERARSSGGPRREHQRDTDPGQPHFARGLGGTIRNRLGETTASLNLQAAQITPQVFVDGIPAEVLFAGAAPNFAGLNQINVRIPEGVTPGPAVSVFVRSGKYTSNQVTLAIE